MLLSLVGIVGAVGYLPHLGERYLKAHLGAGFSMEGLRWGLRGISVKKVVLRDPKDKLVLKAQRVLLVPDVAAFFKGDLIVDQARVDALFLRVKMLRKEEKPLPEGTVHNERNGRGSKGVRIFIRRLVIKDGSFLFVDRSVTPPLEMRIKGVALVLEDVRCPFQESGLLSELYKVLPPDFMKRKGH